MKSVSLCVLLILLATPMAFAKKAATGDGGRVRSANWSDLIPRDAEEEERSGIAVYTSAPATTLLLANFTFNSGATCTAQGWTTVDLTAQAGTYWHVDDFTGAPWAGTLSVGGIAFNPIQGTKSMWMAATPPPANPVDFVLCGYQALPGYGNGWNQSFCTKTCLALVGNLDVAFKMKYDSEPSYDATGLEYTTDCAGNVGWTEIDGGNPAWSAWDSITVVGSYPVGPGPVKVRLHFVSDSAWSNQDGLYHGFGVAVDSLGVETLPVEDFEDEAIGAHAGNDWESCNTPGYGNYFALFKKFTGANYEDQCLDNFGCYWAALQGSTEFYSCGTPPQPGQKIVPHVNVRGQYINNEIWSPVIPFGGSGSEFRLRYTVYRDLPLDNLIYHVWHVRTLKAGCPGPWLDRGFYFYGDSKDWAIMNHSVGSKIDLTGAAMQVAIGVIDLCPIWCGTLGSGVCHSPAPYIDQVKVLRIDKVGPQWDVRDVDLFQDTFAANGTITGTARIDAAIDTRPLNSPTSTPGDSAVVLFLVDPKYVLGTGTNANGLLNDPVTSTHTGRHKTKKQVYMYVAVWPLDPVDNPGDKIGADMSEGPGGQANRYPFMATQAINGVTWTKIRMDYTYGPEYIDCPFAECGPPPFVPNRFNVDLNDNLFTPGDTICYFFSATSADGTTYFSSEIGPTNDLAATAANPMEVTILPAGGFNRGGEILWVNGADGLIDQVYYYGAWFALGMNDLVDRYDVLAPSAGSANRLGGRVSNIAAQLNACYVRIMWDCGPLSVTLGDGTGDPAKTDDYALLNTFLGNLTDNGGVYLSGDDVAENLANSPGASAVQFRSTYMPFTLINSNHRLAPSLFRISPTVMFWPGRYFDDNFFVFGGCPELNDFDVIGASGTSRVEMSYNTAMSPNGAVVWNANGHARVMMSGFSLATLRDDELNGLFDRALFIRRVLQGLGDDDLYPTVGAGDSPLVSALSQNYPNPFNPTTTISFSLATRGHANLRVYNVSGQLVRTLSNETRHSGPHTVTWDGRDEAGSPVSSGVYFCKLVAGSFSQTKKMVLLK